MISDFNFMKYVINYCADMPGLLRGLKIDIPFNGQIYCPFHDNYNTPAAKLYRDSSGYCIFCFNEHRIYRSYDVIKELYNYNIYGVFNSIWNSLSDEMKRELQESYGEVDSGIITVPCLEVFEAFKQGKISYDDLLTNIVNFY